jgi:hypothetical protein
MLHIALVVVAALSVGGLVLMLLSLIFRGFDRTPGCLSMTLVAVIAAVATILAFKF